MYWQYILEEHIVLSLETEPVIKDKAGINSVDKYRPFALDSILC